MFYSANGTFTQNSSNKRLNKRVIEGMTEVTPETTTEVTPETTTEVSTDLPLHTHHHFHNDLQDKVSGLEGEVNQLISNDTTFVTQNNDMVNRITELETKLAAIENNYIAHNDPITIRYPGDDRLRLEKYRTNAKFLEGSRQSNQVLIIESCKQNSNGDNHSCLDVTV